MFGNLSNSKLVCQQRSYKVAITIVSNDEIRGRLKLSGQLVRHILSTTNHSNEFAMKTEFEQVKGQANLEIEGSNIGISLEVRPHFESRDPFTNDSFLSSKGNSKNVSVLGTNNLLKMLATSGSYCIRKQSGHLHQKAT